MTTCDNAHLQLVAASAGGAASGSFKIAFTGVGEFLVKVGLSNSGSTFEVDKDQIEKIIMKKVNKVIGGTTMTCTLESAPAL